jgi:AcrR family transcriptional regulator
MEDVARRSGLARVTIYRHFTGKEALAEAVVMRECQRFFAALDAAVAQHDDIDDRLVEGFAFLLDYLRSHALLTRLLSTEPESLLPLLTVEGEPVLAAARSFLAERLGHEVEEGRLPPLDVEVAGELLARLGISFLLTPASAAPLRTPSEARRFARRYLAPALHVTARDR